MRRSIVLALGIGLMACTGGAAQERGKGRPPVKEKPRAPYGLRRLTGLAYIPGGEVGRRRLDLYLPKGASAPPLLLYIHGGAWVTGSRAGYSGLGRAFTRQGVAVAVIGYRLSAPGKGIRHPDHARDGAAAFAWLRKEAGRYGYDPARIVIGGHSAGAHMAGALAFDPALLKALGCAPDQAAGYLGFEGIYDVPALIRRWPSYKSQFIELAFGPEEGWAKASPRLLPATCKRPWLVVHSKEDELVDLAQSRDFAAHLKEAKVPVSLLDTERGSHFGLISGLAAKDSALGRRVVDFIKACAPAK